MDASSIKTPVAGINGPLDFIVAYGHRLKLHRVNSKDKLNNAFTSNSNDQKKKRSASKLPRVKKGSLIPNTDKNTAKPFVSLNNSGDSLARQSKPKTFPRAIWNPSTRYDADKQKPSHIPRRKAGVLSSPPKCNERKTDNNCFVNDTQHIQRLQVPNVPDFRQEPPTTSVVSSRPIPTLGQIYRHNNVTIDGDRFYDWFMELDTPVNSLESNPRNPQRPSSDSTDTAQTVINVEVAKKAFYGTEKPKVVFDANVYKTTNDNVKEWLASDLEYSKDNESGYRSMSPHNRGAIHIETKQSDTNMKHSDENYCLALAKTSEDSKPNEWEGASNENNIGKPFEKAFEPSETTVKDMPLVEQSTVVITKKAEENGTESVQTEESANKVDRSLEPIVICKSEFGKNLQYPSVTGADIIKDEKQDFAPSYEECPSEIHQRTTNFEGDGLESPNTLSSLACTDLEIHDDYSSQFTLENIDDCNLEDQSNTAWYPGCNSQSCMTFIKSDESGNTTLQNSLCGCHGDKSGLVKVVVTGSETRAHRDKRKYCRLCGRRNSPTRYGDVRRYCKKHSRYRRFPSYRYKIIRPFDALRRRLSLTRMCRHRWNYVWKKTAAKWTNRAKSHSKLGKYGMLEYLQRSIIWENVDVQTLTLVYRETGTHTTIAQQKSAGISASINQKSSSKKSDSGSTSAKSFKSRFKQMNLGPSRFPFFYNSNRKSMPLKTVEEAKTVHKYYSYPENQNKNVEAVDSDRHGNVICLCEDTFETSNANTSSINFHKLRTVDHNLGSQAVMISSPIVSRLASAAHSTQKPSEFGIKDACTQVLLTFNNIETDISFAPIFVNNSAGNISGDIAFYKPCGINTDSIKMETNQVTKQSVQMMTSNGTFQGNSQTGSTASKHSSIKKVSVDISTSGQILGDKTKTDLSTETAPPNLKCTEAKIVSISSAQMFPVAVDTSPTDLPPADSRNQTSSISCQCNTSQSVTCRCDDAKMKPTALYQVSKSTALPEFNTEDRSIGAKSNDQCFGYEKTTSTFNDLDIKQTRNYSTQALIEHWCQPQTFVDIGTTPIPVDKKSTFVSTSVDQKSASAVTSLYNRQSNDFVKNCGACTQQRATASTNTNYEVVRRSVGQSLPDVFANKSLPKPTIDTWVQYSHILDQNEHSTRSARIGHSKLISSQPLTESLIATKTMTHLPCYSNETDPILQLPVPHKSVSVMTSGPFDEASDTTGLKEGRQVLLCGCARMCADIETNTISDLKMAQNRECSTQIFQSNYKQDSDKSSSCGDYGRTIDSSVYNQRSTAEQLTTLSRLIGHPKTSELPSDTSTVLSSNLDAAKWIKRCTHADKEYQSVLDTEQSTLETLKLASVSIAGTCKSSRSTKKSLLSQSINPKESSVKTFGSKSKPSLMHSLNAVTPTALPPPISAVSDDSLADVLPISSATAKMSLATTPKATTDKFTSDEVVSKHLKESILQTCPDISDAATDTETLNADYLKSISVLTSKCILPTPSICSQNNGNSECVFIYTKPHCTVHKQPRIDASVQMSVKQLYEKRDSKCREHTIDQLDSEVFTPRTPSCEPRHTSYSAVAEVLPPKVYKALYETTKMVVKDSKLRSVGDTKMNDVADIENEAALIRALSIRSAAMLTSRCGLSPSDNCQCHLNADPTVKRAEYVFAYDTPLPSLEDSTQTCSDCHARVLEIPPYFEADFVGERMKTQLVGSCRYYSNLLTKRLERVKKKVTKHLAPPTEQCLYLSAVPKLSYTEACTMKPSGREDLGCQTARNNVPSHKQEFKPSCCRLSPSLTNICGGTDKNHLKSVYYMLSAIEGRIRRLKMNIPS